MNSTSGLTVSLNPSDAIKLVLKKEEAATTFISITNTNEQKIIVKLRSNAGKKLRIKSSIFILDSNQTKELEVKLPQKSVDEIIQSYEDSGVLESYRLQFNIAGISDVLFDHLLTVDRDQDKSLSNQWNIIKKTEIQQYVIYVNCEYNSIPSTVADERKSEESLSTFTITDVASTPEYKKLRTQYEAICIVVKRCQEIIRKQQEEKTEWEKKWENAHQTTDKPNEEVNASVQRVMTTVKPSTITGISVFVLALTFVIGFILGQFASRFMK